jgi:hypothetical protein
MEHTLQRVHRGVKSDSAPRMNYDTDQYPLSSLDRPGNVTAMNCSRRILSYWFPPIAWVVTIFVLSSLTFASHEPGFPHEDKFFHAGLFALLSMLFFFAFFYERGLRWAKAALLAILMTSAYGATDEFHQRFTPGRNCDIRDWMADTVGSTVVLLTVSSRRRKT